MTDTMPADAATTTPTTADQRGARFLTAVEEAVATAVVGAERPLRLLATTLLAEGHALLEDVPGVGKTLLARAFAKALGMTFARVQGTPDLLPTDVTGSSILEGGQFRFMPGPVFANVLLVDEINRATPRTQSALLEAMQERQVSAEGQTRPLPDPFLVLATQNPVELEGTFALPEAQLDRFLLRIEMGYPDEGGERRIASRHQAAAEPLDAVTTVVEPEAVLALREADPHRPCRRRRGALRGGPGARHARARRRAAGRLAAQQRRPVPRRPGLGPARRPHLRPAR